MRDTVLFYESHSGFFYGAQQSLELLVRHLDRERFRPVFAGPEPGFLTARLAAAGVDTFVLPPAGRLRGYGGAIVRQYGLGRLRLIGPYLAYAWRLRALIRRERVDVVHCNSIRSLLTIGPAARLSGVPLIWHHRLNFDLGWWNRLGLRLADRIIVVADSLRQALAPAPTQRHKFVTVYNGVDLAAFDVGPDRDRIRHALGIEPGWIAVGTVGSLTPRKGLEDLLDAAARVAGAHARTRFVIIGDAEQPQGRPYAEGLRARATAAGLDGRITFAGWRSDVPRVLHALDVFVLPSHNEGLPRAVLEAMAASLPVVATRVGGTAELVVDGATGLLVPPRRPEMLVEAIDRLIVDPALRSLMGRAGRRRVESAFSIEASVRGVEAVIEDLLAGRRARAKGASGLRRTGNTPVVRASGHPMRRLKVLQVLSVPGVGGAQVYLELVVYRLVGLGYDVTVVCGDDPTVVARYAHVARVHPMRIPYRAAPWSDLRFFVRLLRLMWRERFDVVQTNAAKASLFGRLAARLAGVPVVIFTANGFPFHDFMSPLPRVGLRMLERVMSRWCTDMVISVAEIDTRVAVADGIVPPKRIITIPNGIDLGEPVEDQAAARESLGLAPGVPVVGMVGRLAPQKAPDDFLRTAALVARDVPATVFLVVGDGPLRSDLDRLARELGLDRQVRFLGFRDDVPRVLAALDVFALTSLWEGLPFTILEAMRAGTPVVATQVNGVPEIVEHGRTGLLARPRDTAQLAAHVTALLTDPGRARAMGEAGRRRVRERFDADRMVAELSDLYQRLHATRRPASRGAPGGGPVASDRVTGGAVR